MLFFERGRGREQEGMKRKGGSLKSEGVAFKRKELIKTYELEDLEVQRGSLEAVAAAAFEGG